MKYIVIVNEKYIVTVDAETHGGAEHKILDGAGEAIKSCQAFSLQELATDTFVALASEAKTISLRALKGLIEDYLTEEKKQKELEELIEESKKKISKWEGLIKKEVENLNSLEFKRTITIAGKNGAI